MSRTTFVLRYFYCYYVHCTELDVCRVVLSYRRTRVHNVRTSCGDVWGKKHSRNVTRLYVFSDYIILLYVCARYSKTMKTKAPNSRVSSVADKINNKLRSYTKPDRFYSFRLNRIAIERNNYITIYVLTITIIKFLIYS